MARTESEAENIDQEAFALAAHFHGGQHIHTTIRSQLYYLEYSIHPVVVGDGYQGEPLGGQVVK
jgi:hypothetical protein